MKRDKVLSVRVNSDLLNTFENIVDSHTKKYGQDRPLYHYKDPVNNTCSFGKFSVSDLLEKALKDYCNTYAPGKK